MSLRPVTYFTKRAHLTKFEHGGAVRHHRENRFSNMKKIILIIAAIAAVGLIALVVILTLSLGSIIKKGVETVGPQLTRTEMKLDGASVSVLSGDRKSTRLNSS